MIKKFFIFIIFILFLFNISITVSAYQKTPQPLKIEQTSEKSYKYGSFEKTYNNPALDNDEKTSFTEKINSDRKEKSFIDVFNALIFVIILILITGWIYMKFKRINPEQLLSGKFNKLSENNFKIISSLQLGAGKAIHLIEINNKQLIVGTTSTNINLLAQMDKVEENKEIPKECIERLFENNSENYKKLEE